MRFQMLITLCSLYLLNNCNGIKIKDRMVKVPKHHFTVGVPCGGDTKLLSVSIGGLGIHDGLRMYQKGINYSMECIDEIKVGTPDENGTYDGLLGLVQSNKYNFIIYHFPYNSIDYEPGYFIPSPVSRFVPHIYSAKIKGGKQDFDVLSVGSNFDHETWLYWWMSLTICSVLTLTIVHYKRRKKKFRFRKIMKQFTICNWNYIMLILDMAPTVVSNKLSCSIIWTFIVLAIYYGIHMVFWSTLSADLSANLPDSWIDTLDDLLFDPKFEKLEPIILKQYLTYTVLSGSAVGSNEELLLNKSIESGSLIFADPKKTALPLLVNMFVDFAVGTSNGTKAIVEDSLIIDTMLSGFLCYLRPEEVMKITKSQEFVYNYPTAGLLSHATHPAVVELFTYRSLMGSETGQSEGVLRHVTESIRTENQMNPSINAIICAETFLNILQKENYQEWNPLPMSFFLNFFFMCLTIILLAVVTLIFERFIYSVVNFPKVAINNQPKTRQRVLTSIEVDIEETEDFDEGQESVEETVFEQVLELATSVELPSITTADLHEPRKGITHGNSTSQAQLKCSSSGIKKSQQNSDNRILSPIEEIRTESGFPEPPEQEQPANTSVKSKSFKEKVKIHFCKKNRITPE